MLDNYTLIAHKDEIIAILNYLDGRKNKTATAIGSWCGMSNQKARCLCNLMAKYNLIHISERKALYGRTILYTRNELPSKKFLSFFKNHLTNDRKYGII